MVLLSRRLTGSCKKLTTITPKKSLGHLPKHKKDKLKEMVNIICAAVKKKDEMIILFGSYARGDGIEDVYTEGHIT